MAGRPTLALWTIGAESKAILPDGSHRVRYRYGSPTGTRVAEGRGATLGKARAAAKASVERARQRHEQSVNARGVDGAAKIGAYAKAWLDAGLTENGWSDATRRQYTWAVSIIRALPLAKLTVESVTRLDVKGALSQVARERGKGTAKTVKAVLVNVFERACDGAARTDNPAREIRLDDVAKDARPVTGRRDAGVERIALSQEQVLAMLNALADPESDVAKAARGTRYSATNADIGVVIATWFGLALRVSEVLSLRWDDVNLSAEGVSTVIVRGTKTEGSTATLTVPPFLVPILSAYRARTASNGSPYVFAGRGRTGQRDPKAMQERLHKVLDAAGHHTVTGHGLRRAAITAAAKGEGGIPVAQGLARHASAGTTLRHYVAQEDGPVVVPAFQALAVTGTLV